MILSKALNIFVALLWVVPATFALDRASMPALQSVVEAEKAFARAGLERGIRESFLQFFADESIIFAPEPKDAKKFYTDYEEKGRKLIWQSIFATIANSAELGVTTGPWEMQKSKTDGTSIAFGHFVSIWKKQSDNSWKVILDVGIDHPQPAKPGEVQLSLPNATQSSDVELAKREGQFEKTLKSDAGAAVLGSASQDIRVYRDGSFPAVGKDAARTLLDSDHGKTTRKTSGGHISTSGDLAYRYGSHVRARGNAGEPGYYLTIWQTDRSGVWKIILDLEKKAGD